MLPQYTASYIWHKCFHGMHQCILIYTAYKLIFLNTGANVTNRLKSVWGLNLTLCDCWLKLDILVKLAPVLYYVHQYKQELVASIENKSLVTFDIISGRYNAVY